MNQVMPAWAGTVTRSDSERAKTTGCHPRWARMENEAIPGRFRGIKSRGVVFVSRSAFKLAAHWPKPVRLRNAGFHDFPTWVVTVTP